MGVYYSDLTLTEFHPDSVSPGIRDAFFDATGNDLGTDLIFEDLGITNVAEVAVYGEVSFEVTEDLKVTVGARYFDTPMKKGRRDSRVTSRVYVAGVCSPFAWLWANMDEAIPTFDAQPDWKPGDGLRY